MRYFGKTGKYSEIIHQLVVFTNMQFNLNISVQSKNLSYSLDDMFHLDSIYVSSMFNTPRLTKELSQLFGKPPVGIRVKVKDGSSSVLEAGKNYVLIFISEK